MWYVSGRWWERVFDPIPPPPLIDHSRCCRFRWCDKSNFPRDGSSWAAPTMVVSVVHLTIPSLTLHSLPHDRQRTSSWPGYQMTGTFLVQCARHGYSRSESTGHRFNRPNNNDNNVLAPLLLKRKEGEVGEIRESQDRVEITGARGYAEA